MQMHYVYYAHIDGVNKTSAYSVKGLALWEVRLKEVSYKNNLSNKTFNMLSILCVNVKITLTNMFCQMNIDLLHALLLNTQEFLYL